MHLIGGSIWVGGHLILAVSLLPEALARRDPVALTISLKLVCLAATLALAFVWLGAAFRYGGV